MLEHSVRTCRALFADVRSSHTPSRDTGHLRRNTGCVETPRVPRRACDNARWHPLTATAHPGGESRKGVSDDTLYAASRRCGSHRGLASLRSPRNFFPANAQACNIAQLIVPCGCDCVPRYPRGDDAFSGDWPLRNPITGIVGCCARAVTGHAAAPPSNVMSSRRLRSNMGEAP